MGMQSSTLQVGDKAPGFTLEAINLSQTISLKDLLKSGPTIVEFHRGTW
jgi:peroxiredoxin